MPENMAKERLRDRQRRDDPRVLARKKLQALNRRGNVEKGPCVICGVETDIECHHPDHKNPYDFICLCASCRRKLHKEFREEMKAKT